MLSEITRRIVVEEAQARRWSCLGHVLSMYEERIPRVVRKMLIYCVEPTKESLFGDSFYLDVGEAIGNARDRNKWKIFATLRYLDDGRPRGRCRAS